MEIGTGYEANSASAKWTPKSQWFVIHLNFATKTLSLQVLRVPVHTIIAYKLVTLLLFVSWHMKVRHFFPSVHFHLVSTPASSRYTTSGAPVADPRVMQLTRSDPRQKQGTPPTTPLTQVHPQPAPLHFMQQQPQQPQLAGRFPMPPSGVLPPEPNQLPFFGTRDSQPPPLMSPVAMVCSNCM